MIRGFVESDGRLSRMLDNDVGLSMGEHEKCEGESRMGIYD